MGHNNPTLTFSIFTDQATKESSILQFSALRPSATMSTQLLAPESTPSIITIRNTSRTPTILTFPLELHLLIASHLPFPAYLSLRLSHPYLYYALAAPRNPVLLRHLDQCARVAVRTYLAPYLSAIPKEHKINDSNNPLQPAITTMPQTQPTKDDDEDQIQRCALCGNTYPLRLFKSAASPACSTQDFSSAQQPATDAVQTNDALAAKRRGQPDWDVVEMPERVCCWHVGRLARVVRAEGEESTGRPRGNGRWVSRVEQMCTHCGAIQAWRQCRCRCQSCSVRPARTYTRYAEQGWSCAGFLFWRDGGGKLWVRETVWTDGKAVCTAVLPCSWDELITTTESHHTTAIADKPVIFE